MRDLIELFAGSEPLRERFGLAFEPGSEQRTLVGATLAALDRGDRLALFAGAAGTGKCLAPGTPVLRFDGSVSAVEDIKAGDRLMGANSSPRRVLSVIGGRDLMYRISPVKGDSWVCTQDHVLTLAGTNRRKGETLDIRLCDYLKLKKSERERDWKLFRVGVSFPSQPVPYPAYLIGLWLGDGDRGATRLTNSDPEIIEYCEQIGADFGYRCTVARYEGKAPTQRFVRKERAHISEFRVFLDEQCLGAGREKVIPRAYLVNDRATRSDLLAGLLDTDGHLSSGGYEIVTRSHQMSEQILFLARSLGFAAYATDKLVPGYTHVYKRLFITGEGLENLPLRVSRKKARPRKQVKRATVTGFQAAPLGEGEFYGFALDGDGRFLLGDFTVTHNSTCTLLLLRCLEQAGRDVSIAAPTWKAAARATECLEGRDVVTLHSIVYAGGCELIEARCEPCGETFRVPNGNPCPVCGKEMEPKEFGDDLALQQRDDGSAKCGGVLMIDECFDYRTRIFTERGTREIGTYVNLREESRVWSRNPTTGNLELKRPLRWLKNPAPDSLLEISASRTDSQRGARVIRCTPSHKILTPTGYVRAEELAVGGSVLVRGAGFTPEQRSLLVGSLFGDGSLNAGRTSPQIRLTQGEDQEDYLAFKRRVLGVHAGQWTIGASGYGDKRIFHLNVNVTDETFRLADGMLDDGEHPSGRRRWSPSADLLALIDAQALAIWYLDDGSTASWARRDGSHGFSARLHAEGFSEGTHQRIVEHLQQAFGIYAARGPDSRGNHFLTFSTAETAKLFDIVAPFVPSCMQYKLGGRPCSYDYDPTPHQQETQPACIQSIDSVQPSSAYVYDIEVEDHHNYLAGNIVVSNCSMIGTEFAEDMWRALPEHVQVVAIGDPHQLPPVRERPGFLLHQAPHPLTHVYRQADASPVLQAATRIRQERVPFTYSRVAPWQRGDAILSQCGVPSHWLTSHEAGSLLADTIRRAEGDAVAIVGTHRSRVALNDAARAYLGFGMRLAGPAVGERLVCRRQGAGLRNADTMQIESVAAQDFGRRFGDGWVLRVQHNGKSREIAVLRQTWDGACEAKHRGLVPLSIRDLLPQAVKEDTEQFGDEIAVAVLRKCKEWRERKGEAAEEWLTSLWRAEEARRLGAWAIYLAQFLASVDSGYAITCHQAQGSQYREIVVVADSVDFIADGRADEVYRWSYTALTRAVEHAVIVKKSKGGWL